MDALSSGEEIALLLKALAEVPQDVSVQLEFNETGITADTVAAVADSGVDARFASFPPQSSEPVFRSSRVSA